MRLLCVGLCLFATSVAAQQPPAPIIDMHLHASAADAQGPPPLALCAPGTELPVWDPSEPYAATFLAWMKNPTCADPVWSPMTDDALMSQVFEVLDRRNIYAVTSGPEPMLRRWQDNRPSRIIPGLWFGQALRSYPPPDELRQLFVDGRYKVFAEVAIQYDGASPSDAAFEPYMAIAEELDLPMGIHIGTGPPGAPHLFPAFQNYRARLHSPLILEEALMRHPRVRVYVMHAGWPMLDDLLALMWAHPHVYIGVGNISYVLPRAEFHQYLKRIVEAGLGKRVMFGSDQMVWPGAIERAIGSIESAAFLDDEQKRDILFNNAARFLRLSDDSIAAMRQGR